MKLNLSEACPFAPGEIKPESIYVPHGHASDSRKALTLRIVIVVIAMFGLALLYSYFYNDLSLTREPMIFWDEFVLSLGIYTYVSCMLVFFIMQYKRKTKQTET